MVAYMVWVSPQPQPTTQAINAPQAQQAGVASNGVAPVVAGAAPTTGAVAPVILTVRPSTQQLKDSQQTVVNSGTALFTVNHLGARIQSVKLKGYKAKLNDDTP